MTAPSCLSGALCAASCRRSPRAASTSSMPATLRRRRWRRSSRGAPASAICSAAPTGRSPNTSAASSAPPRCARPSSSCPMGCSDGRRGGRNEGSSHGAVGVPLAAARVALLHRAADRDDAHLHEEQSDRQVLHGGELRLEDIMVVAPYNHQVACLRERLPTEVRVGTVRAFSRLPPSAKSWRPGRNCPISRLTLG